MALSNFVICRNKNFQFVLPNGYRISVGIGFNHFCQNHDNFIDDFNAEMKVSMMQSNDCEVLVMNSRDNAIPLVYDESSNTFSLWEDQEEWDVNCIKHVNPIQFLALITYVSSLK